MFQKIANIINWLKANKLKVAFILLVALILIAIFALIRKKSRITEVPQRHLTVLATNPLSGDLASIWPTVKIKFTFNELIDPDTIKYSVSPYLKTRIIAEERPSNSFEILSLEPLKEGVEYKFTITKTIKSLKGLNMEEDYVFPIRRLTPKPGDIEFPVDLDEVQPTPEP